MEIKKFKLKTQIAALKNHPTPLCGLPFSKESLHSQPIKKKRI